MNFLKRTLLLALSVVVLMSVGSIPVAAQTSTTGAIIGTVTDPSGAVVPDAAIELKDNAKGTTQTTKTGGSGVYQFNLLAPSSYTITVTAAGFQTSKQTIEVPLGSPITVNVPLSVAGAGTTVTVTEAAPLLQTENGDTATALSQQQVSQLPNPGNDLSYVAQFAPGVVMNTQGGFGNLEAFGMPGTSNLFTLNGMDDNDPFLNLNNSGATNLLLGANEIQEADVVTNGYSTSIGTFSGVNVNYITKSGSNNFHGNALWQWNGRAMNANDWFNNTRGNPRPFDNANQWAASFGGPIKKDKFFFFLNTEGMRVLIPVPSTISIPSPQFEAATIANLTSLGLTNTIPYYCQNSTACPGVGPLPGSGGGIFNFYNSVKNPAGAQNNLPTGLGFDPATGKFDIPTGPDCGTFTANAAFTGAGALPCGLSIRETPINFAPEKQIAGRADWNIGVNDRAFLRMQYDQGIQPTNTDPINPLFNTQSDQPEYQGQLVETHSFGSNTVNQFLLAGTWYSAIFKAANQAATLAAFPTTLLFNDGSYANIGGINFAFPQGRNVTQIQSQDDVSRTWRNHAFKFGGKYHKNYVSDHDGGVFANGLQIPLTLQAFYQGGFDRGVFSGTDPLPDFSIIEQRFTQGLDLPVRLYEVAGYALDEWRIKPNFTVTPGLRLEHASNPTCVTLCFAQLSGSLAQVAANPTAPYNQQISANRRQALQGYQNLQWEPRISFAWQPFGTSAGWLKSNLVVRGGIGIFYDIFPGTIADNMSQNPPLNNPFIVFPSAAFPGFLSPNQPGNVFASAAATNMAFLNAFATGGNAVPPPPPGLTFSDSRTQAPQFQKWSLEIQKGFGASTSMSVGYYGNHGIHLPILNNSVNAFGFGTLPAKAPTSQFGTLTEITSAGISNYNGMVASFQHRFSRWTQGLLQLNYTYSHAFDEISNGGFLPFSPGASVGNPQDPNNIRGLYGPADYDVRHGLNGNYVWELPIKTMLHGHGSDYVTRGWQVSGAVFFRTGLPFTVWDGAKSGQLLGNNYGGLIYPNIAGASPSPNCGSEKFAGPAATPCLAPSEFVGAVGANETAFGNPGLRNLFRGPKYFDTDFTIMKNTKIPGWERGQLGLGLQFFNLFNHPNFNLPVHDVSNPFFGTIQSAVSPPTSILGSFLGGDASSRLIQVKAQLQF